MKVMKLQPSDLFLWFHQKISIKSFYVSIVTISGNKIEKMRLKFQQKEFKGIKN